MTIQLVCLDMAGTTVADDGAVLGAFGAALDTVGPSDPSERARMEAYVVRTMGQSKIAVFRALLGDDNLAQAANAAFEAAYDRQIDAGLVHPIPGAAEAVAGWRAAGVRVALLTGFSAATRDRLVARLGWQDLADVVLCPAEAGRGRPAPDLVLTALLRTGADDVAAVAAVGDTASDMESGRRAGASLRIGVLTGAHGDSQLRAGGVPPTWWSRCGTCRRSLLPCRARGAARRVGGAGGPALPNSTPIVEQPAEERGPVPEVRDDPVGILGVVVPPPEADGVRRPRRGDPGVRLRRRHRSALTDERPLGGIGHVVVVGGISGAQPALGLDMEADRFADRRRQVSGQEPPTPLGVVIVAAAGEPADVVQEGGNNELVGRAGRLGQGGGLAGVG
ncbi:MAG TPA: HAD family hydrolase [Acidimicrobiales bacterium]|nr:HAD family hydrolase [Acidimicrobiales bacterium]